MRRSFQTKFTSKQIPILGLRETFVARTIIMASTASHFHIVLTTHNSRISERMRSRGILPGPKSALSLDEEIFISAVIGQVLLENLVECIAFNNCGDHVHLLILDLPERISHIIKLVKGRSSFLWRRKFSQYASGL